MRDSERKTQRIHMEMAILSIKLERRKARYQPQTAQAAPRRAPRRPRPVLLTQEMLAAERQQRNAMEFMRSQQKRR